MGNNASSRKNQPNQIRCGSYPVDDRPEPRSVRASLSPFKAVKQFNQSILDIPDRPGKVRVSLTNLQSDKPSGSCVTDSVFLDWSAPRSDGGSPILWYIVEMYDLPTGNWVEVTHTEDSECRSMLDNILCGIMYRFRVRARNEVGCSVPGIPSDAFVIDTPGVHIAPYFILCPPPDVAKLVHSTVQFHAKALGTPSPNILWQIDNEPIFVTQGIDIEEEPDGSILTVHNLQPDDEGVIECVAVNPIGKATASAKLRVLCPTRFIDPMSKHTVKQQNQQLNFTFSLEEMVRLKFPIISQPSPHIFLLFKDNVQIQSGFEEQSGSSASIHLRDGNVIVFKLEAVRSEDGGQYRIEVDNQVTNNGPACLEFKLNVEVMPNPPGAPEILEVLNEGASLCWDPPVNCGRVDHYIVEYYRDQWKMWLRMKTCIDPETVITDLIPGSKYKFRVMGVSTTGVSDPGPESEEVMIGKMAEDELFDLPRGRQMMRRARKMPSLDRSSVDRIQVRIASLSGDRRHTSLDREVYYDANNERRDVVTYKPLNVNKIGSLSDKYKLSGEELAKYRMSLSQLCHKMKSISNSSLVKGTNTSKTSQDSITHSLQLEINHQARKATSLSNVNSRKQSTNRSPYIDRDGEPPNSQQFQSNTLSGGVDGVRSDVADCRKSLTDIRDRIGSLQSLLKTSRTLTASKQQMFADLPKFAVPPNVPVQSTQVPEPPKKKPLPSKGPTTIGNTKMAEFANHRNDSYIEAIDNPIPEKYLLNYQETHFPYNPELASLGSLECDKFPQELSSQNLSLGKVGSPTQIARHNFLNPNNKANTGSNGAPKGTYSPGSHNLKAVSPNGARLLGGSPSGASLLGGSPSGTTLTPRMSHSRSTTPIILTRMSDSRSGSCSPVTPLPTLRTGSCSPVTPIPTLRTSSCSPVPPPPPKAPSRVNKQRGSPPSPAAGATASPPSPAAPSQMSSLYAGGAQMSSSNRLTPSNEAQRMGRSPSITDTSTCSDTMRCSSSNRSRTLSVGSTDDRADTMSSMTLRGSETENLSSMTLRGGGEGDEMLRSCSRSSQGTLMAVGSDGELEDDDQIVDDSYLDSVNLLKPIDLD